MILLGFFLCSGRGTRRPHFSVVLQLSARLNRIQDMSKWLRAIKRSSNIFRILICIYWTQTINLSNKTRKTEEKRKMEGKIIKKNTKTKAITPRDPRLQR